LKTDSKKRKKCFRSLDLSIQFIKLQGFLVSSNKVAFWYWGSDWEKPHFFALA